MKYSYKPNGVCSMQIDIEIEDSIIKNVEFIGGCSGNTQGIARLVKSRSVSEVIAALENIKCGFKNTSCPDQLACALKQIQNKN